MLAHEATIDAFSNLLHHACTGDFVESLVRNARTVDELAMVTYVEAPTQHVIVEFSFDVAQAARGRCSSPRFATPTASTCRNCSATRSAPSPPTATR